MRKEHEKSNIEQLSAEIIVQATGSRLFCVDFSFIT